MVCSRGRWESICTHFGPFMLFSVELVQIIQVIATITTSEYIYRLFVSISSVHIARTWRFSLSLMWQPSQILKIKYMKVVCC